MIVSGGDDSTVRLWDQRKKQCAGTMNSVYQTTAVCFNDTAESVFSGGVDNDIKVFAWFAPLKNWAFDAFFC